jgi:hypothetical protein
VVAVGDEGGAADLAAYPDAKYGHRLVAQKTDHGGHLDRPKHLQRPRIEDPVDDLVAGDAGNEEYD